MSRHGSPRPLVGDERVAPQPAAHQVEVRRSARRRRTVSAYRDGDRVVVLIPDRFSAAEEREWVRRMVSRVADRPRPRAGDAELAARAAQLSARYLDGAATAASVRWVARMRTRWASCTPADATIRLSRQLQEVPAWVRDYVLLHELAHLIEPGHDARFWELLAAYPRTERARGYLDGLSAAAHLPITDDLTDDLDDVVDVDERSAGSGTESAAGAASGR